MSAAEIQQTIDAITAALKGPMTNLERALLVADRKDARAALAKLEDALTPDIDSAIAARKLEEQNP